MDVLIYPDDDEPAGLSPVPADLDLLHRPRHRYTPGSMTFDDDGHGEPIQKQFAFEDREHVVGVICHDPRCLPEVDDARPTNPGLVQGLLQGELGHVNGDGANSALPPPPYGIALTAGGKVLRFALASLAAVSTRKGRAVVKLDPLVIEDLVVGVEPSDGTETVCLATRSARVLIFPVTEANVVAGVAKGVTAIKLDSKDRVLGFATNKMREGLTVRTSRGSTQIIRATKYPVTGRGGKGYGILQRGTLDAVIHDEARPIPPVDQVGDST